MIKKGQKIEGSKVLWITFKENCPDIRVIDVIRELQEFGCDVDVSDYWADKVEVKHEYNLDLIDTYIKLLDMKNIKDSKSQMMVK